ncbi:hypothetical protein DM860_016780 [Cuscuta australis]|uniref:DNL-type domain-containing protein n=1 Tax=Cuscuta australis TaxID=267555 RepID=A0A328DW91_9ASTE|nr:hypothetical protein DM860_016780 [Cuscuta australis]
MAALRLYSRILPVLVPRRCQPSSISGEHSKLSSSGIPAFNIHEYLRRTIRTNSQLIDHGSEQFQKKADCSLMNKSPTGKEQQDPELDSYSALKDSATSSLKASPRHDLAMIYTCKVCETRSAKTVCRESYEKGVVVVRCGGCNNLHLIADRLGWFGQPGSIEDLLAARGEEVKKGSVDSLSLTLEDLAGKKL